MFGKPWTCQYVASKDVHLMFTSWWFMQHLNVHLMIMLSLEDMYVASKCSFNVYFVPWVKKSYWPCWKKDETQKKTALIQRHAIPHCWFLGFAAMGLHFWNWPGVWWTSAAPMFLKRCIWQGSVANETEQLWAFVLFRRSDADWSTFWLGSPIVFPDAGANWKANAEGHILT